MAGVTVNGVRTSILLIFAVFVSSAYSINMGQVAVDVKRLAPVVIKKYSQNSPVFINVKSDSRHLDRHFIGRMPDKPPPKKRSVPALASLKLSRKFPRSIISPPVPKLPLVPLVLPMYPKSSILPLVPTWLPPPTVIPPFSISPMKPVIRPLGKVKRLASSWDTIQAKTQILGNLIELKHKGSLTNAEFRAFKNVLLK